MDMKDRHRKRCFDLFVSCFVLMLCFPALGILILLCRFETGQTGIFAKQGLARMANALRYTSLEPCVVKLAVMSPRKTIIV